MSELHLSISAKYPYLRCVCIGWTGKGLLKHSDELLRILWLTMAINVNIIAIHILICSFCTFRFGEEDLTNNFQMKYPCLNVVHHCTMNDNQLHGKAKTYETSTYYKAKTYERQMQ